jgi:hypothetical protein
MSGSNIDSKVAAVNNEDTDNKQIVTKENIECVNNRNEVNKDMGNAYSLYEINEDDDIKTLKYKVLLAAKEKEKALNSVNSLKTRLNYLNREEDKVSR